MTTARPSRPSRLRCAITGIALFVSLIAAVAADELRLGTLNCYLLFHPAIEHVGKVDNENPLSPDDYQAKIHNLARLGASCDVLALQETGGKKEISDLAQALGFQWGFAKGRDTITGQEVGLVYRQQPGWRYAVDGRVGALDRVVSKHLLVTATHGNQRVRFLVVHLLRPIGENAVRQAAQIAAIDQWAAAQLETPGTTVVVMGDMNCSSRSPVFTFGTEVNRLIGYQGTHLNGTPIDRMVASSNTRWSAAEVVAPPYGPKPNNHLKRVWSDHFLLVATLEF